MLAFGISVMGESMKGTQRENNPFPYSDSNKRYYTYEYYLRKKHGGKCAKIPIDAGFTCPNIDGRCGFGGCIYCSSRGSGDFAAGGGLSVTEQYRIAREKLATKWSTERCIPYFQAHTNTYAPLAVIRPLFEEAVALPGAVGLNVATRADCLEDDVVAYLAELADRTALTVELGLQTTNDDTACRINRGHTYEQFIKGYKKLRSASKNIEICVHLIFGLPGEDDEMMLRSVRELAMLAPDHVKLHLLHVLRSSRLGEIYERGAYTPLERAHYIDLVVRALTMLPPETVIARLTGDGMGDDLLAPDWSRKKVSVINDIDKKLYENNLWQGKYFGCDA